jgi:hypothetical protein
MLEFHQARQWLGETYGQSDTLDKDVEYNLHWAFFMKFNHYKLYLKGDEEFAWFQIRYGAPV